MGSFLRLPLCLAVLGLPVYSQPLATGTVLVATAKSNDPDFARSVVLLIRSDRESAIGLILNHPTSLPVTEVLPDANGYSTTVYAGGPVAIGVRGLVRTKSVPYFSVISSRPELIKLISSGARSDSFRIYAGYVGWTAQQLHNEVARGLWKTMPPDVTMVFGGR
jgi:putative transcriptional regulator